MRQKVIDAYYETKPPLVPLLLQKVGYTTASIGRNHFQFGTTRLALDPGFETVFDNRRSQTDTVHVIDRSIKWLDANQDRKFFLLVNISPPHQPYNPPDKYKKWTKARLKGSKTLPLPEYLSEIYYADQEIGRLLQHLDELRLTGRTAILVTADHGETMHNDHSCYSQLFKTICHTSHGLTLYDEELHVPFIWSLPFWPDLRQGERTSIVSHLDAAPTLLALAGAAPNVRYTGRSLLPDMLGEPAADEELYFEMRMASGVRINGWKFILHHKKDDARTGSWTSDPGVTSEELYDLANDPYETKNLASRRKDKAEELRQDLRRIRTRNRDYEAQTRNTVWTPVRPPGGAGTAPPAPETAPAFAPAAAPGQEPTADPTNEPEAEPDRPDSAPAQSPPAQPAAPDAAPPGAAQPHADSRGYLYLALNHGGRERRFTGEVRTEGAFAALEVLGDPACIQEAGPHSIRLDCAVNEGPFRARVQVVPPLSPVVFDVTVDGKPLSASYFYLGRYGLALAAEKRLADPETWALARSVSAPHFLPGFDPGIFVWHDMSLPCGSAGASLAGPPAAAASDEAPAAEDFEGEQIEDETTRNALKAEGYWK
jgi:arylsulfatase A-like enzyme